MASQKLQFCLRAHTQGVAVRPRSSSSKLATSSSSSRLLANASRSCRNIVLGRPGVVVLPSQQRTCRSVHHHQQQQHQHQMAAPPQFRMRSASLSANCSVLMSVWFAYRNLRCSAATDEAADTGAPAAPEVGSSAADRCRCLPAQGADTTIHACLFMPTGSSRCHKLGAADS